MRIGLEPGKGNGNPLKFLPREFLGQRRLVGYSSWGRKELESIERLSKAERYLEGN